MTTLMKRDMPIAQLQPIDAKTPLQINPLLESMAQFLDNAIPIPGTPWRIGLDGLIGLIPGIGDLATLASGAMMMQEAKRLGLPRHQRARIAAYYLVDALGGLVPILGDVFDFAFKANKKSLSILRQHLHSVNSTATELSSTQERSRRP